MVSAIFLLLAAAELVLLIWVYRQWRRLGSWPLALLVVPLALQWADAGIIGLGRAIGEGETLLALNQTRFFWHIFTLPILLISLGSLLRLADFPGARHRGFQTAFCLAAVVGWVSAWPWWPTADFHPACYLDTLRYVNLVAAGQQCHPGQALGASSGFPVLGLAVILVEIAAGAWLWWRRQWPWLTVGAVLVLLTAMLPVRLIGMVPGFIGDGLSMLAFAVTAAEFSRRYVARAAPASP